MPISEEHPAIPMTTPATDEEIAELEAALAERNPGIGDLRVLRGVCLRVVPAILARLRAAEAEAERIRAEERERGLYAGVLHLLAECSVHMREHEDAEELRDMIELAMEDAAGTGRFQWRRVLNRFEVWPSAQGDPNANK